MRHGRARAELGVCGGDGANDAKLGQQARRGRRRGGEGREEQARRGELGAQQRDARLLAERGVVRADARARQQLAHKLGVHPAVLAHVEWREVEAEGARRRRESLEAPAHERARAVRLERGAHDRKVGREVARARVAWRGGERRGPHEARAAERGARARERARRGREARVDVLERGAVGLVGRARARRGLVDARARRGERPQRVRDDDEARAAGELRAERVHLGAVVLERKGALALQRAAQRRGVHVWVAVAVAADPGADREQRRQVAPGLSELPLEGERQPRHGVQEGALEEAEAVGDLVGHGQLAQPQDGRRPQRDDAAV